VHSKGPALVPNKYHNLLTCHPESPNFHTNSSSTLNMRSIIALSAAAFAGLAAGQATPQYNYPYTIDPETVSQSDRGKLAHSHSSTPV